MKNAKILAPLALVLSLLASPASADQTTPCGMTASELQRSCRHEARDDFWLHLAICTNRRTPDQRSACEDNAASNLQDDLDECDDQTSARLQVCEDLGGGRYHPLINPANFVSEITNPYLPLTPGKTFRYRKQTSEEVETDVVRVTHRTKEILGVPCTVVHDIAAVNGELVEDTLDYFAQDTQGNVWYFGEETKQFEGGDLIGIKGSFQAGRGGDKPGIIMKANPQVGDVYRQEFALGRAEDVAEVKSLSGSATVPFGSFHNTLVTGDSTPLEPGVVERKFYALGVGSVLEVEADGSRLELVSVTTE